LFTDTFTLLVGPDGAGWIEAAEIAAAGIDMTVRQIGTELHDPDNQFLGTYGITETGATLVRPDGFVAWRADTLPRQPERELQEALTNLLALAPVS
jgi:putative polyketide hydroxylase